MKTHTRRAMTLVEILAVVVILGMLSAALFIGFSGTFSKAKHELARSQIGILMNQLEKYKIERGQWPTNDEGLAVLTDGHATPAASYYVQPGQLEDPWDRTFLYVTPGPEGHPYEIITYGLDGQPGGEGEDADITSVNLKGRSSD